MGVSAKTTIMTAWPLLTALLLSAGCAASRSSQHAETQAVSPAGAASTPVARAASTAANDLVVPSPDSEVRRSTEPDPANEQIIEGTGNFINRRAASTEEYTPTAAGDVVLNFEQSDIKDVVKTILVDILDLSYSIDPRVSGTVSLATARPISRDSVIPTLEALLKTHGAVLSRVDGVYYVTADGSIPSRALKPRLDVDGGGGYQILIVPLRYLSASAIQPVLQPLLPADGIIAADSDRNQLIIGGSESELKTALDTVRIFDVDQMAGMSIGFFRLESAEASNIKAELDEIFGFDSGPLAGMVRFVTVDRLNALIVITPQKKYLADVRTWIRKLDRADAAAGLNMYVYPVQNARASHLAELLGQLFSDRAAGSAASRSGSGDRSPSPFNALQSSSPTAGNVASASSLSLESFGVGSGDVGDVRIISDDENNSLIIMAARADYAKIANAIRKLDVLALQVLVEATIVEVTLTDELSYGLQWFFKNGFDNSEKSGAGELFPLTVSPSFRYTVSGPADDARAVLNLLAADSRLDVVSSPSLMVLDNHTATIRVGDQVPIRTSETTSLATSAADPLITSTIQYRDTGVLLEVTPRVNLGGMVVLEITQDVNDVDQTTTSEIDSPTIIQRRITTTVAVQSGETVVLGGLIRDNEAESESGIPGLRNIPGVGRLFGSRTMQDTRTELLVLITPTAVRNMAEARAISQEMKEKMAGIDLSRQ